MSTSATQFRSRIDAFVRTDSEGEHHKVSKREMQTALAELGGGAKGPAKAVLNAVRGVLDQDVPLTPAARSALVSWLDSHGGAAAKAGGSATPATLRKVADAVLDNTDLWHDTFGSLLAAKVGHPPRYRPRVGEVVAKGEGRFEVTLELERFRIGGVEHSKKVTVDAQGYRPGTAPHAPESAKEMRELLRDEFGLIESLAKAQFPGHRLTGRPPAFTAELGKVTPRGGGTFDVELVLRRFMSGDIADRKVVVLDGEGHTVRGGGARRS